MKNLIRVAMLRWLLVWHMYAALFGVVFALTPQRKRAKRRREPLLGAPERRQEDSDIITIKRRIFASLLPTDPAVIEERVQTAWQLMQSLQDDGSWEDVDYGDQTPGPWKTPEHLNRVLTMAKVYNIPNQELYRDSILRIRLIAAFDFWLANDFQNPNWWHNLIGVPRLIGYNMILIESELNLEQFRKGITILQRSTLENATGANLTWQATNILMRGCLEQATDVVAQALEALFNEIKIAGPGQEGIQADFSFHQHDALLYSGGYGLAFTFDTMGFVMWARDTRFAVSAERLAILAGHVLDGQQWMMRGVMFDYGSVGREITRPDKDGRSLINAIENLAQLPGPRQEEFIAFRDRLRGESTAPPLVGNRHFWKSDFMAHHREGYYTSARMFSTRTFNTDGYLNGEGRQTEHVADGATYIFRTGEEYRDIFPVWNWRRVPGITCEQSSAPFDIGRLHIKGPTSFVGGVSDGMYGLAAMDFQGVNVTAKKAWIYFDDAFVCLGAGITCLTGNPAFTSVNQCLLQGEVWVDGPLHRSRVKGSGEHILPRGGWAHHDEIGYLFPGTTPVTVTYGPQTGSWSDIGAGPLDQVTKDVFSVWLDHGRGVVEGDYYYIVFPGIAPQDLAARAIDNQIQVLSNTPTMQAVHHSGLRLCGAAFHQPGSLAAGTGWTIGVDKPCLLLLYEKTDGVQLTVSNPENQPLTVIIDIDRALECEGCTPGNTGHTRVSVDLPGGAEAGRSVILFLRNR